MKDAAFKPYMRPHENSNSHPIGRRSASSLGCSYSIESSHELRHSHLILVWHFSDRSRVGSRSALTIYDLQTIFISVHVRGFQCFFTLFIFGIIWLCERVGEPNMCNATREKNIQNLPVPFAHIVGKKCISCLLYVVSEVASEIEKVKCVYLRGNVVNIFFSTSLSRAPPSS